MFHFKQFDLEHEKSTLKIGTDAVVLAALADTCEAKTMLDIGCGCGVVAFCATQKLLSNGTRPEVYAIDTDPDSVTEAKDNAKRFPLLPENHFHIQNISIQDFAREHSDKRFGMIVSNPPFFHNDLKPTDSKRLRSKHGDGQLSFEELVECSARLMDDSGVFAVIIPKNADELFRSLAAEAGLFCKKSTYIRTNETKPASRVVLEFLKTPCNETASTLSIRDTFLKYTSEYLKLMEPFLTIVT